MRHARLAAVLPLLLLTGCGGASTTSTATPPVVTQSPQAQPTSPPPVTAHHVTYTWGVSRPLKPGEWENIGISWTNPITGAHELPPETSATSTTPLRFPYSVSFNVTDLIVDNQHIMAASSVDVANLTVDCTVIVDGQVLVADLGTRAVIDASGNVQTGGESFCIPQTR